MKTKSQLFSKVPSVNLEQSMRRARDHSVSVCCCMRRATYVARKYSARRRGSSKNRAESNCSRPQHRLHKPDFSGMPGCTIRCFLRTMNNVGHEQTQQSKKGKTIKESYYDKKSKINQQSQYAFLFRKCSSEDDMFSRTRDR